MEERMSRKKQSQQLHLEQPAVIKHSRIYIYCRQHLQAVLLSIGRIIRAPFASFITLLVLGIAMSLPAGLYVLLNNVQHLSAGLDQSTQISVYLKNGVDDARVKVIMAQLSAQPSIGNVRYISPTEGLAEFQQHSEFSQALNGLSSNPLPGVILVQPASNSQTPTTIQPLLQQLKLIPDVDQVQLDMEWVQRLYAIIQLAKRSIYLIAALLGLGVILIIGNTTYLTTQRHRREIEVLRMVGATNAFIRRPFLYSGMLYGLIGSVIAWLLILSVMIWLHGPAAALSELYGSKFQLNGLGFEASFALLAAGILLGICGAWIAVSRYLRLTNSEKHKI